MIHIQGRRAEAFRQLTAGIPYDQTLIGPLDVGKNADWAAFLNTRRFARAYPNLPTPKPLATCPLERQMIEALITPPTRSIGSSFIHLLQHDEPFDPPDIPDYPAFCEQWEVRMQRYLAEKKQRRQPKTKRRRPRKRR